MHRSGLPVFVIFAAAAACSTHDDSEATRLLSKDPALGARLETAQDDRQLSLPEACGTVKVAAQPSGAVRSQADELTRQADKSEILGNVREARTLLRRAVELDATNASAAYHLGRASEELGDSTVATTAYCQYLALSPSSAESAEARARVTALSRSVTSVSAGSVADSVGTSQAALTPASGRAASATLHGARHTQQARSARASVTARATSSAPATHSVPTTSSLRHAHARVAAERSTIGSATSTGAVTGVPVGDGATEQPSADSGHASEEVATGRQAPSGDQPSTASRPANRGPNRAQSAGIGAATGAILGAITGHSMKSTVIGAAAGGILGTMVGRGSSPIGSGSFH